jgi:hypothetical protein
MIRKFLLLVLGLIPFPGICQDDAIILIRDVSVMKIIFITLISALHFLKGTVRS